MLRAETREHLRRLIREIETQPRPVMRASIACEPEPVPARPWESGEDREPPPRGLREAVRRETDMGPFTYRELRYDLDHCVGEQSLSEIDALCGAIDVVAPDAGADGAALESLLFLDIETTGLGGAGVVAFLVATGRVEGGAFVLRQYLAESPGEEGALLDALIADSAVEHGEPVLATYNGRAFDAPMLDARATMHRRRAGFESLRHVDLLMPARAMYRGWLSSCRLAVIESEVMGLTRPSADVDGAEVPAWYYRYLRTGDMRCIEPIASHNAIDVLSLAALAGRLGALVAGRREPVGGESLGLARLFEAAYDLEASRRWLERAAGELGPGDARRETLMRLGLHYRRAGRHDLAEPLWWELVSSPGLWSLHAHEELAKYYEHRCHDFARASAVVERAIALAASAERRLERPRRVEAFQYRLARLTSRMMRAASTG